MNLSVVSVAMHLSGLDAQHFTNGDQKVRWLYEDGARKLHSSSPALSTTSTASTTSSSGFNSWGSESQNGKEDLTVVNVAPPIKKDPSKVIYNGRNILDLNKNLTDPKWEMHYSVLPKDPLNFFKNRSQYARVYGDHVPLHVDVACPDCAFIQSIFD